MLIKVVNKLCFNGLEMLTIVDNLNRGLFINIRKYILKLSSFVGIERYGS